MYTHGRRKLYTHRERPRGEPPRVGALLLGRLGDDDLQRVDPAGQQPVDAECLCGGPIFGMGGSYTLT